MQLEEGQRYYYGYRGRPTIIETVPGKLGLEFFAPVKVEDVFDRIGADDRLARPGAGERQENPDLGNFVVVSLAGPLTDVQRGDLDGDLRSLSGVRTTHPVMRTVHSDSLGQESLITGRISLITRADYPEEELQARFFADIGVVIQRIDFPRLNRTGYIVEIEPTAAEANGEDVIAIANRIHRSGPVLHAAPTFAPLYVQFSTPLEPGDYYYKTLLS